MGLTDISLTKSLQWHAFWAPDHGFAAHLPLEEDPLAVHLFRNDNMNTEPVRRPAWAERILADFSWAERIVQSFLCTTLVGGVNMRIPVRGCDESLPWMIYAINIV